LWTLKGLILAYFSIHLIKTLGDASRGFVWNDLYRNEEQLNHFVNGDNPPLVKILLELKALSLVNKKILMESWMKDKYLLIKFLPMRIAQPTF
jgi:hypothetical protein